MSAFLIKRCLKTLVLAFVTLPLFFGSEAVAQVAITLGVQEVYDTNIFLENGERSPNPFVLNDAIEEDIADGQLSILGGPSSNGEEDSDFITNVFLGASGDFETFSSVANSGWDAQVGLILFGEFSDLNRVTLDSNLRLNLSDMFIPKPFYVGSNISLSSQSQDISTAQGSSARSSQFLRASISSGINEFEIASSTFWGLGYTGSYNAFLGELFFNSDVSNEFQDQGSDSHTHFVNTSLSHQLSSRLRTGLTANGGISIFTNIDSNDSGGLEENRSLDRFTGEALWIVSYVASERLNFGANAGFNFASFVDEPEPFSRSFINEDGETETAIVDRDGSQASLVFGAGLSYVFQPGSVFSLNLSQERVTDIDGDLVTTRSLSSNITKSFGDRFTFNAGGSVIQFSSQDDLSNAIERFEASLSLNYLLTQSTSLVIGGNYTKQDVDDSSLGEALSFRTQDFDSSRIFIGLNTGFLGL